MAPDQAIAAPRRRWSVRVRILSVVILVATVGLAAAGGVTLLEQRASALGGIDARLRSAVAVARSAITDQESSFVTNADAVQRAVGRVPVSGDETSVGIVGGAAAFVPDQQQGFTLADRPALVTRVTAEVSDGTVRLGTYVDGSTDLRYIAVPVAVVPGAPTAVLLVAIDLDPVTATLTSGLLTYLLAALVTLVAIGLVGWFIVGRLLRPLHALTNAAAAITAHDRTARIPVVGNDDISGLTENVNAMLDRLDSAITTQRQLLEDVRHELRTPVTIVRGHLEVLDPSDEQQVGVTRSVAIRELDRMTRLIEEIELLADAQASVLDLRPVDARVLTEQAFELSRGIPGHSWVLETTAVAAVTVDAERITQAWLQLMANAARYSPEGSEIRLGSRLLDGGVEFWVADMGPGIPEEARTRIFERFGRVDQGRGSTGSGLGLAIVRAIVAAHGGRITLETSPSGSRFGILIPREEVSSS